MKLIIICTVLMVVCGKMQAQSAATKTPEKNQPEIQKTVLIASMSPMIQLEKIADAVGSKSVKSPKTALFPSAIPLRYSDSIRINQTRRDKSRQKDSVILISGQPVLLSGAAK